MLKRLSDLFHAMSAKEQPKFAADDHRIAAAALLVHVMMADGEAATKEHEKLKALLQSSFALSANDAQELIEEAQRRDEEAVDLYNFTSLVKRSLDEEGRARIIEMLWEISLADGHIHELEENTIWRVAELIGVSSRERMMLKKKVLGNKQL